MSYIIYISKLVTICEFFFELSHFQLTLYTITLLLGEVMKIFEQKKHLVGNLSEVIMVLSQKETQEKAILLHTDSNTKRSWDAM